jgi:transportin-3
LADGLENLEALLVVIRSFGEELPTACSGTCSEAWGVIDGFLSKYGDNYELAERTTRVLRYGITFFGNAALGVACPVAERMAEAFEKTGLSGYVWIGGKIVQNFGDEEDPKLRAAIRSLYERSTNKVASILSVKPPELIPDGEWSNGSSFNRSLTPLRSDGRLSSDVVTGRSFCA